MADSLAYIGAARRAVIKETFSSSVVCRPYDMPYALKHVVALVYDTKPALERALVVCRSIICRTKACHSTRGLASALTCFSSVLEAAVGGAPDDASQGCLSTMSVACLRVCADLSDFLLWSLRLKTCIPLSPVQLKRAGGNKCVRCAHHTHCDAHTISPIWSRRVSSFFMERKTDRQTDRQREKKGEE